ncbi:MAG TPA: PilZ domain-containing protein [Vicinamibacterales bacterium]
MRKAAEQTFRPSVNRRREARTRVPAPLGARLLGGVDVVLHNVSRRGLLLESPLRLIVGAPAILRLRVGEGWAAISGRVIRSRVISVVDGRVRYESALHLEKDCPVDVLRELTGLSSEGSLTVLPDTPFDPTVN